MVMELKVASFDLDMGFASVVGNFDIAQVVVAVTTTRHIISLHIAIIIRQVVAVAIVAAITAVVTIAVVEPNKLIATETTNSK